MRLAEMVLRAQRLGDATHQGAQAAPRALALRGETLSVLAGSIAMAEEIQADPAGDRDAADIAFVVRNELSHRAHEVEALGSDADPLFLLYECNSAARRVEQSLGALDTAVANSQGTSPAVDRLAGLDRSLKVRRLYAQVRRRVLAMPEPTAETVLIALRAIGTEIAVLVGQEVYGLVRVQDKLRLRSLQARILDWLRAQDAASGYEGLPIWKDFVAFMHILRQVNHREELVEHDRRVVKSTFHWLLGHAREATRAPEEFLRLVHAIGGLDDEVDEMLAQPAKTDLEQWQAALRRVWSRFPGAGETGLATK